MAVAILGLVGSFLGPAMQLGQYIVEPIKRRVSYLCCFNSNVQNLRDEAKNLENVKVGLQMQVTRAENNAHEIVPRVEDWLKDVGEIQEKMSGIEMKISNIQSGGCLALKSRFSLSKIARKTTEAMKQLQVDGHNFNVISQPPPPASMAPIPLGSTYCQFQSRKHIIDDIMTGLRDENVKMLGICGMGGVGKTTMAKQIMEKAKTEHLFDDIVMVVVGQQVDKLRIQGEMAGLLGLELKEQHLSSRARELQARLMKRRTLLAVDDVWEYLDLEELIGIPPQSGLKGCTILLTSRDEDVLSEMGANKVCEIETLNEVEAWSLFKAKVGACVDDQNLLPIARKIVEECKGLPIALVNVAMALKVRKYKSSWEDALKQLKSSNPVDMPKIIEHVYNPIKLSYNFLESQHPKSIFLLCCLFPEDYDISLEYLTYYAMGLQMFEDIRNLGEARNRICSLVEMLRSRFLLLEGKNEYYVRMHDVVRDVAIFIAKEERRIMCSDCTWISTYVGDRIFELPVESISPKLHLLLVNGDSEDEKCRSIGSFLAGQMELNVLYMEDYSLKSLPRTTQFLKNLTTLILVSCESLKTIHRVGELVNLEILIFCRCYSIRELPSEIMRLKCLRLLEIEECESLGKIAAGVISSLDKLEKLKIVHSFKNWEAEDKEKKINARLSELESLYNLTWLEIEVEDFTLAAQHIRLPPNIVKYYIGIGELVGDINEICPEYEKTMMLIVPREITLGNWIHEFARSVECMYLDGDCSNSLDMGQARWLSLNNCTKISSIVGTSSSDISNLSTLEVYGCNSLRNLSPLSTTRDFVRQLKRLEITDCRIMEQVFLWNEEENESVDIAIMFPKLEQLALDNLPNLTTFFQGIESIDFPVLTEMSIAQCSKLRSFVSTTPEIQNHHHSIPLFSNPKVVFGKLEELNINNCNQIRSIFSCSMARNFVDLIELYIDECNEMVKIIEGEEECSDESTCLFPHLKKLWIDNVPKLKFFCQLRCALEFPSLEEININDCFEMETFSLGSLTIPKLNALIINDESIAIVGDMDLNHMLHQKFLQIKEEQLAPSEEDSNLSEESEENDGHEEDSNLSEESEENDGHEEDSTLSEESEEKDGDEDSSEEKNG